MFKGHKDLKYMIKREFLNPTILLRNYTMNLLNVFNYLVKL